MALPLTGITTTIVSQAIGLASNSVNVLCNNYNINKWSKFKPVRYDSVAPNRGAGADWWRANDGNCGLNIPNYPTMPELFTALRAGTVMWDYLPPLGTTGQPCRLADFRAYEHTAQPPMIPLNLADIYYASLGTMGCALDLRVPSDYELTINDIGYTWNLGEMYFGVAISKQGTTGYKYMTESTQIGTGGDRGITVPITSELGTYEVVFMLVENQKLAFETPDITNRFVPLYMGYKTTIIEYSPIFVSVTATWVPNTTSWEVSITNNGDIQITLTGCSLKIRYGDTAPDSDLELGEASFTIPIGSDGTITVLPNSTQTITGTRLNSLPYFNTREGLLYFRNNNSAYNATGNFEM